MKLLEPAATLDDALAQSWGIVAEARERYAPEAEITLFSGGHDSTILTHLLRQWVDAAAHINTGTGIPQTTEFVRATCKDWRLPLIELVTPPGVYEQFLFAPDSLRVHPSEKVRERGFPGPSGHQAVYYYLKQQRIRELRARYVKKRGQRVIFMTGIRASESNRRMARAMSVPIREEGGIVWVSPILHFDTQLMNQYRDRFPGCPRNPVSDLLHRSGECLCGAFARAEELEEIELWFPEVGARIRDLERRLSEEGVVACKWGGQGRQGPPVQLTGQLCFSCDGAA